MLGIWATVVPKRKKKKKSQTWSLAFMGLTDWLEGKTFKK